VLREGRQAPDFKLASSEGQDVSLRDLRGKTVVLYFYPKDDTPGCTKEACAFRDAQGKIEKTGAVVLGVSPDPVDSHRRFRDKYRLGFPLLADPDKAVAKRYGAFGEKVLYGRKLKGIIRSTFVIDDAGVVRKVFPKVRVDGHAEQVLAALQQLVGMPPPRSPSSNRRGGSHSRRGAR
jgi:thioredoxin-dependent peroxiredoxin